MRRTTISLPDDLADALDREARRRSLPASAIARDALSDYLGIGRAGEQRAVPFAAVGRSGANSTGRDLEELLERQWDNDARGR
jgi:predicted transcriptional regulator